jgi:hypothetical protein
MALLIHDLNRPERSKNHTKLWIALKTQLDASAARRILF